MKLIDLHCDTAVERIWLRGEGLRQNKGQLDLRRMKAGELTAQVFALMIYSHKEAASLGLTQEPWALYEAARDAFFSELAACGDEIALARSAAELEPNESAGKRSALLSVEDGPLLYGDFSRIAALHRDGVRLLTLTWNYENCFGYPNSADPAEHARGLKPFGKEAVECLNETGIVVDVSHLSRGGFFDVADVSKKPFVASHSCARALCDHPRNLDDDMLRVIGECGGVVGVNYYPCFLREDSRETRCSDVLRHTRHIVDRAGMEAAALGSDFDGIGDSALEFVDCAGVPAMLEALRSAFTDGELDKLTHKNALRVLRDCIG